MGTTDNMGGGPSKPTSAQMQEMVFALKMQSKEMARAATKCTKEAKKERAKILKAMQQNNAEGARIYSENCIRQQTQHMQYLKLSARIDAVAGKLDQAVQMNKVSEKMCKITQKMGPMMNTAMDGTTSTMMPEDDVKGLMEEVGREANIEYEHMLPTAPMGEGAISAPLEAAKEDDLERRLRELQER